MAKKKIYELAENLGKTSKEVLEVAKKLKIDVKSHLSSVEETEAKKIMQAAGKKSEKPVHKKEEKNNTGEEDSPVIIRRSVIRKNNEDNYQKPKKVVKPVEKVNKKPQKDYNIVYRDGKDKPLTVSELFGLAPKEEKKTKETTRSNQRTNNSDNSRVRRENNNTYRSNDRNNDNNLRYGSRDNNNSRYGSRDNNNSRFGTRDNNNSRYGSRDNNNSRFGTRDNNNSRFGTRDNNNSRFGTRDNNNSKFGTRDNNNSRFGTRDNNNSRFGSRDNNNSRFGSRDNNNSRFGSNNDNSSRYGSRDNNSGGYKGNRNFNDNFRKKESDELEKVDLTEEISKGNIAEERKKSRAKEKEKESNRQVRAKKNRSMEYDEFGEENIKRIKHTENISGMIESGDIFDFYPDAQRRRGKGRNKKRNQEKKPKVEQAKLTKITIPENITVKDLAQELKVTASDLLMKLMNQGVVATLNNSLDFETAYLLAQEYGIEAEKKNIVSYEDQLFDNSEDDAEELEERPPVVVVMGHVDHGKTSLLDAIRNTNKIGQEAGGITQHIGAYQVKHQNKLITFLDTPGHAAFTAMRARGAKATDIAILVVAANDGVMPQTIEAINHAKLAEIPIIVAINKIDLPDSNIDKIKQELSEHGLVPEAWGGDTIFAEISAKNNQGIDELLELVQLQAEVMELKANNKKQAKGTVIESRLDKSKGPVVTMLVNRGELNVGDTVIIGTSIGRIRKMVDYKGKEIKNAGPSTPVEVTGITTVPEAGEIFYEVSDEKTAKKLIAKREQEKREAKNNARNALTLESLFENVNAGNIKTLNIVIKADVSGSAEALKKSLEDLSTGEVQVKVVHLGVGAISETDVTLAQVSNGIIIAFNVRPDAVAKAFAEKEGIEINSYSVIYNAIDDVKEAMIGMLDPEYKEVILGTAEVRALFKISKIGTIAGSYVTSGKITRSSKIRVIRDNVVIADTKITSLKREKDDAKEVASGYECGIQLDKFNDLKEGDTLEAYIIEEIKRKSLKEKKSDNE